MAFEWKSLVGTLAPTIATAIGGPLAGTAVAALAGALGLRDGATEEEVATAVQKLNPEQIVAIKKADLDFKTRMAELNIDLKKLNVEDRKSAREREVNTGDSTTPRLLAVGALALFSITLIGTFVLAVLPDLKISPEVTYLLGAVQSASALYVKSVYDYYLGNNSESGIRDQMIFHSTPLNRNNEDQEESMPNRRMPKL